MLIYVHTYTVILYIYNILMYIHSVLVRLEYSTRLFRKILLYIVYFILDDVSQVTVT